jgi:DNA primase
MLNKPNRPKWKHIGKKSQWIYPAYLPYQKSTFLELIEDDGTVILVESIGDLLSLHEQGYYNVLVTFGLDISPTLISVLVQLNPQRILLCFNNDTDAEENRGLTASFKNYLKLLSYIDYQKLFICLPTANDFGDMTADNFEKWKEKVDNLNPLTHSLQVLDGSQSLADQKKLSKKLLKNRNILKEIHDV